MTVVADPPQTISPADEPDTPWNLPPDPELPMPTEQVGLIEHVLEAPDRFARWLMSWEDENKTIGYRRSSGSCPLAAFARKDLGLYDVQVDGKYLSFYDANVPGGRNEITLPAWAAAFAMEVDQQLQLHISAALARKVLSEILAMPTRRKLP